ncbi:hypothetical protein [Muricoccus radiodurans]|uniref:hypothetical protein n=1 Tax=Muricoccus radiodurans TaxID=2231721 RepID=UPI003CED24CE
MTQADPVMGSRDLARNSSPLPLASGPSPAVAALLRVVHTYPRAGLTLRRVDAGHPEEGLAHRAATLASLAVEALAFLAGEARCDHLADSLWEQVTALEDAPAIRAPVFDAADRAAQLADHRYDCDAEDRTFSRGRYAPEGRA